MRALKKLFTAEELLCLSATGKRLELVKGKVYEMAPAGGRHGHAANRAAVRLTVHTDSAGLGHIFTAETGFLIHRNPDTVRAPDVSFVSVSRLALNDIPDGYIGLAPDLVAEVVSPGDTRREVREKVEEWLNVGVRLVWVLYPITRTAAVYRSIEDVRQLAENDFLDGEEVVPGFACRVEELFA
jgi:Uma2 family endonuclease